MNIVRAMADYFASDLDVAARLERIGAAVAGAAPRRVEASDSSGTVEVVVGSDGLPESIQIAEDWLRTVGSEALGDAVVQACRDAMRRRRSLWTDAVNQLPGPARGPSSVAVWEEPVPATRPPRLLLNDLLAVLDDPDGPSRRARAAAVGTGTTGFGKLTLTLHLDGGVSCAADPHWVAGLEAGELTEALNKVLASARTELAANSTVAASDERIDDVFSGLWGILRSLQ
jgi:DNA-binding protein YbaB